MLASIVCYPHRLIDFILFDVFLFIFFFFFLSFVIYTVVCVVGFHMKPVPPPAIFFGDVYNLCTLVQQLYPAYHTMVQHETFFPTPMLFASWYTRYRFNSGGRCQIDGISGSGISSEACMIKAAARDAGMRSFFRDSLSFSLSCSIRRIFKSKMRSSMVYIGDRCTKEEKSTQNSKSPKRASAGTKQSQPPTEISVWASATNAGMGITLETSTETSVCRKTKPQGNGSIMTGDFFFF